MRLVGDSGKLDYSQTNTGPALCALAVGMRTLKSQSTCALYVGFFTDIGRTKDFLFQCLGAGCMCDVDYGIVLYATFEVTLTSITGLGKCSNRSILCRQGATA